MSLSVLFFRSFSSFRKSFFYRLDPRTKLVSLMILSMVIFKESSVSLLCAFLFFFILFICLFSIPFSKILKSTIPLLFFFTVVFLLQFLFTPPDRINIFFEENFFFFHMLEAASSTFFPCVPFSYDVLLNPFFKFGPLCPSVYTFFVAFRSVLKFVLLIFMSASVTETTRISFLILGLENIFSFVPLKRFGITPTDFAFMVFLSVQLIPFFSSLIAQISVSVRSRGLVIRKHPILYMKILSANVINSLFNFSQEVSYAMESRGYTGIGKTSIHTLNIQKSDIAFFIFVFAAAVLIQIL